MSAESFRRNAVRRVGVVVPALLVALSAAVASQPGSGSSADRRATAGPPASVDSQGVDEDRGNRFTPVPGRDRDKPRNPVEDHPEVDRFSLPVELDTPREMNRGPMVMIQTWNGSRHDPEGLGRIGWWRGEVDDAIEMLGVTIRGYADLGVRRFCLKLPAGSDPNTRMAPSQFEALGDERAAAVAALFDDLRGEYEGIAFGFYAGWGLDSTPSDAYWLRAGDSPVPFISSAENREAVLDQYGGAVDLGLDFIIIDAISGRWANGATVDWMNFISNELGIDVIGEAYPADRDGKQTPASLRDGSFFALHGWVKGQHDLQHIVATADPQTSQYYVAFHSGMDEWSGGLALRMATAQRVVDGGFIPAVYIAGPPKTPDDRALFAFLVEADNARFAPPVMRTPVMRTSGRSGLRGGALRHSTLR